MNIPIAKEATPETRRTAFLDKTIPLEGASHADVVSYAVDCPVRYSECVATLSDGQTVRFLDSRQFVGWSDSEGTRHFLFRSGYRRIEIQTGSRRSVDRPRLMNEMEVFSWPSLVIGSRDISIYQRNKSRAIGKTRERKFIARDGSLLLLRGWVQSIARRILDGQSGQRGTLNIAGGAQAR